MGAPVQFDPWAVLQELRQAPAAIAATAATACTKSTHRAAATAAIAAKVPNAANAAVAARGGVENRELTHAPPPEWLDAIARIGTRPRPESIPPDIWARVVADAGYLVREWGQALSHCGWTLIDIFAAHPVKPLARYDAMGLCLLLQGRRIGPIDSDRIAIRQAGGTVLHFRRRPQPEPEAVMLWQLP